MKHSKIKWKVAEAPTGRYRSFFSRDWPHAYYENGDSCAFIKCDDSYRPADAKSGNHSELKLYIADWSISTKEHKTFKWKVAVRRPATVAEAKVLLNELLEKFPSFRGPKELFEEQE